MRKFTIILVDDEESICQLTKGLLEGDGYNVLTTNRVDDAINLIKNQVIPHVLVTDDHMPGKSGLELVKWIRLNPQYKNLPVIVTSGYLSQEARANYKSLGAKILDKPVPLKTLQITIRQCLPD
ncbi:MAG: response regulator [Patescibacteria group bacterium]